MALTPVNTLFTEYGQECGVFDARAMQQTQLFHAKIDIDTTSPNSIHESMCMWPGRHLAYLRGMPIGPRPRSDTEQFAGLVRYKVLQSLHGL